MGLRLGDKNGHVINFSLLNPAQNMTPPPPCCRLTLDSLLQPFTSQPLHQPSHLWKERSESEYSVHRLGNCVEDLETGSSSDSAGTCLLKYLFASRLMEDIWRLDIFRFTPLLHLFRVWLALAMNLFTVPWSRHNSFAISVDFLPSARQRTIVYSFPLQWDLSACPSLAL